jgi:glycerol uptake facilitator protein
LVGAVLGALGIWALFTGTAIDLGVGMTSFNEDTTTWGSAIFAEGIGTFMLMFAILGIVDTRSPGDFAGIVIGGVVVAIIMIVGPVTGASLNQLIPVYVLPGLVGAALASVGYDFLAKPRLVERPIQDAVTQPDPVSDGPIPPAAVTH